MPQFGNSVFFCNALICHTNYRNRTATLWCKLSFSLFLPQLSHRRATFRFPIGAEQAGTTISNVPPPTGSSPHLTYRPEIDGLRSIAVLSVVLYHFGVPFLNGGFVGVDIFFVISGFLIGGLLMKELRDTGRIALGRFYMRRVRRLAPAYFAMAGASALVAWFILLPFEFREFGKSLIAATLWLSNVQFWREAGYFDIGADSKVLLHTWSLSVEEQFYVFLPLFLIIFGFLRKALVLMLVGLWAASLALCVWLTPTDPTAAFFLFPFRAWEMLTGVLVAIWSQSRYARPLHDNYSFIGLLIIIFSILLVRSAGFPGWQAILPVVGTAMLLANTNGTNPVNMVLSKRGPVFIGLVSYSLYLWHWPVLVLSKYWRDGYSGPLETAAWLAVCFGLAVLSWALVERPLRRAHWIKSPLFLGSSIVAALTLVGFGALAFVKDGMPNRFAPEVRGHIAASGDFLQDWSRCYVAEDGPFAGVETCAIGPQGEPEVIFWGDSHLRALMDGIGLAAIEAETPGLIIWHAGCPPLFDVLKDETAATAAQDSACYDATEQVRRGLQQMDSVERIMLIGRWTYYAEGSGTGRDAENLITLEVAPGSALAGGAQVDIYAQAMIATVAELNESFDSVHVFRQVPEIPFYSSRDVARGLAHGTLSPADAGLRFQVNEEVLAGRVIQAETPIYELASNGAITLIDPWPLLCPERCSVMNDGRPVYFDNNHLTNAGAILLRPLLLPFLTGQNRAE